MYACFPQEGSFVSLLHPWKQISAIPFWILKEWVLLFLSISVLLQLLTSASVHEAQYPNGKKSTVGVGLGGKRILKVKGVQEGLVGLAECVFKEVPH